MSTGNKYAQSVIEPRIFYFGTPVVLITTENPDGSTNLAPMSSAWWVGGSCMLGLDGTSQTTLNLQRTGELALNLPDSAMVNAVDRLALRTATAIVPAHKLAKGYTHVADKFGIAGLTPERSDLITPARVAECPISLEARVTRLHPFEQEDSGILAIETEILRTHVRTDLLVTGSERHIDPEKWDPLIMKFTHFYGRASNLQTSELAKGWQVPAIDAPGQLSPRRGNIETPATCWPE